MFSKSILSYQGPLSFSTIDWLLSEFKLAAEDHDLSFRTYKKMISLMIEALENITKHSEKLHCNGDSTAAGFCPSCQISRNASNIELMTRNPVRKKDVDSLRTKIDYINERNREELKELYKSTITNGEFSPKGGAGLGFIEMAKTAGNKLEYAFENLSKDYSLYTLRVSMSI
ncbi:MAG: SiaB family protein kinase [Bacteroidales bacterium]|nr:SiaB family protein kinase [Bacteroidales bacterium]